MNTSFAKSLLPAVLLGAALFGGKAEAQEVGTYTELGGPLALGYPVPLPIDSLTPVDGFRSFASLQARHLQLAFSSNRVQVVVVGRSLEGRPILAYRFGDRNKWTAEGLRESATLVSGTVHAREWQSPEVVTEIFERLALNNRDDGVFEYFADNLNIVMLPLSNPDGFLQTQRWPDQVVVTPSGSPRDGRQRRKNKLDTDDDLFSLADHLLGVDLNRNFPVGFGGGSPNPESIVYHGQMPLRRAKPWSRRPSWHPKAASGSSSTTLPSRSCSSFPTPATRGATPSRSCCPRRCRAPWRAWGRTTP